MHFHNTDQTVLIFCSFWYIFLLHYKGKNEYPRTGGYFYVADVFVEYVGLRRLRYNYNSNERIANIKQGDKL